MLNRRHLRIKVFQAIYAYMRGAKNDLGKGERELLKSIDRIYELFVWHLSVLDELRCFAEKRIEERKSKKLPSQEDLNPNMKFVENPLLVQISENAHLRKLISEFAISWVDESDNIKKLFLEIEESELYQKYMVTKGDSYEDQQEFILKVYKYFIADNEMLQHIFEETNIHWTDDHYFVCGYIVKFIKAQKPGYDATKRIPKLYKDVEDDTNFVQELYRKTLLYSEEFEEIIMDKAKNWEADRIAVVDFILMKMAVCELMKLPSVPIKVTLNEYIELSKTYSTPKSRVFINGVLDKIVPELKEKGMIKKTGRGLME